MKNLLILVQGHQCSYDMCLVCFLSVAPCNKDSRDYQTGGDHKNPMSQPSETFIPYNLVFENILKWASVMASLNWQPTCINYQHNMAFTVVFAFITCSSCGSYGIPIDVPEAVPLYL